MFMPLKRLLNFHEEVTHLRLRHACEQHNARVYAKVRIADTLPIDGSGISDEQYSFALRAHFDFVVTDSFHSPLFAVEFDGPSHETENQQRLDSLKNALCDRFELPLLRVKAQHLVTKFRNFDLLSWIVETWFLADAFNDAQASGIVPYDEPFDPMMFSSLPGRNERFPMWLSVELRIKIQRLSKAGKCLDPVPSEWIGKDNDGTYRGITWIRVTEDSGVCAHSAMRSQQFPIVTSELLSEILVFEIHGKLEEILEGTDTPEPRRDIYARLKTYEDKYKMCCRGVYGGPARKSAT